VSFAVNTAAKFFTVTLVTVSVYAFHALVCDVNKSRWAAISTVFFVEDKRLITF
jgi:hypothetical protein